MNLTFVAGDHKTTYGVGATGHIPRDGEHVWSDGTDPDLPRGGYLVSSVHWQVGLRGGAYEARVYLVPAETATSRQEERTDG